MSRLWPSGIVKYYYWEVALRASRPTTAQRKAEGNWSDFSNQAFPLEFLQREFTSVIFFSPNALLNLSKSDLNCWAGLASWV